MVAVGENYDGSRVLKYEWVKSLYDECKSNNVMFCFIETGTKFEKDGKIYTIPSKRLQSEQAYKSGLQFAGKPIQWNLYNPQTQQYVFAYTGINAYYLKAASDYHWQESVMFIGKANRLNAIMMIMQTLLRSFIFRPHKIPSFDKR